VGLHSFRSMRRMEARRRKASDLGLRHSQSLANRRQRPSQANLHLPPVQRQSNRDTLTFLPLTLIVNAFLLNSGSTPKGFNLFTYAAPSQILNRTRSRR
jgi:hypothetical protein